MTTRAEFLDQVWKQIINSWMNARWIDMQVASAKRRPDDPFADLGPALERLLAAGADPRDLCLLARQASYEAVFQLLYMFEDPGVDDNDSMMHEELLGADPSGRNGRPGSV
jgi:hypothetical protein